MFQNTMNTFQYLYADTVLQQTQNIPDCYSAMCDDVTDNTFDAQEDQAWMSEETHSAGAEINLGFTRRTASPKSVDGDTKTGDSAEQHPVNEVTKPERLDSDSGSDNNSEEVNDSNEQQSSLSEHSILNQTPEEQSSQQPRKRSVKEQEESMQPREAAQPSAQTQVQSQRVQVQGHTQENSEPKTRVLSPHSRPSKGQLGQQPTTQSSGLRHNDYRSSVRKNPVSLSSSDDEKDKSKPVTHIEFKRKGYNYNRRHSATDRKVSPSYSGCSIPVNSSKPVGQNLQSPVHSLGSSRVSSTGNEPDSTASTPLDTALKHTASPSPTVSTPVIPPVATEPPSASATGISSIPPPSNILPHNMPARPMPIYQEKGMPALSLSVDTPPVTPQIVTESKMPSHGTTSRKRRGRPVDYTPSKLQHSSPQQWSTLPIPPPQPICCNEEFYIQHGQPQQPAPPTQPPQHAYYGKYSTTIQPAAYSHAPDQYYRSSYEPMLAQQQLHAGSAPHPGLAPMQSHAHSYLNHHHSPPHSQHTALPTVPHAPRQMHHHYYQHHIPGGMSSQPMGMGQQQYLSPPLDTNDGYFAHICPDSASESDCWSSDFPQLTKYLNSCGVTDKVLVEGIIKERLSILAKELRNITKLTNDRIGKSRGPNLKIYHDLMYRMFIEFHHLMMQSPSILCKYENFDEKKKRS